MRFNSFSPIPKNYKQIPPKKITSNNKKCYNKIIMTPHKKIAYIIAVDMGYGHQRAAYPLRHCAKGGIINANAYPGMPKSDRSIWQNSREVYEFISRFKKFPVIGDLAFNLFDKIQSIPDFYPRDNQTKANLQVKSIYSLFKRKKWGKHLIDKLAKKPLPIITTFFTTAFMAEYYKYPGEIYCLATDTDVSRSWAPLNPQKSRIKYFAPSHRVEERLQLYGIPKENIFVTGFPLPEELVGRDRATVKTDLGHRLFNLDPNNAYLTDYKETIIKQLGKNNFPTHSRHPLTITFAVGGAGAQKELGIRIAKSLKKSIQDGKVRLFLVAGIHNHVSAFFRKELIHLGLGNELGKNIRIIFNHTKKGYFQKFNRIIKETDILWTKPSELSFYTALGLPIIMSEPIGSQEHFNRSWLRTIGSGVVQENPDYTDQWLFDWLKSGWFAEAAMDGFLQATCHGLKNIISVVSKDPSVAGNKLKKFLNY